VDDGCLMNEQEIFDNAKSLISPLGQFHYRGIDFSIVSGGPTYIPGEFHSGEDGDASYHTGILGQAMVFRYLKNPNKIEETAQVIDRLLSYFELFIEHVGHIGRNIVSKKAYDKFLPQHKNGTASWSPFLPDKSGDHMRYKEVNLNGNTYYFRYDVSPDQMTGVVNFLYWVVKIIPNSELAIRARNIAKIQLEYYEKNDYLIKDDDGKLLRYGYHKPISYFLPVNLMFVSVLKSIIGRSIDLTWYDKIILNLVRTYMTGIFKSKKTRDQFNNYMITMNLHSLINEGIDLHKGIKRMFKETEGEKNFYNHAVENHLYKSNKETANENNIVPRNYHSHVYIPTDFVVPFEYRTGYNYWEASPYRKTLIKKEVLSGFLGNEDILQAYWLGK